MHLQLRERLSDANTRCDHPEMPNAVKLISQPATIRALTIEQAPHEIGTTTLRRVDHERECPPVLAGCGIRQAREQSLLRFSHVPWHAVVDLVAIAVRLLHDELDERAVACNKAAQDHLQANTKLSRAADLREHR
jgi:hypothetical protein